MTKEIIENRCCKCKHCSSDLIFCSASHRHIEPPADCALEELDLFMAEWSIPVTQRQRLLEWSNRRSANVLQFLSETVQDIINVEPLEEGRSIEEWKGKFTDIKFIAAVGMKTCAIKEE